MEPPSPLSPPPPQQSAGRGSWFTYCACVNNGHFTTFLPSFTRIGRTGRFGRAGLAINFVDGVRSMQHMRKIEEHFGRKITKLSVDDPDLLEQAVAS